VSGPREVEIRRRLPAAVSQVFRWWTEADRLEEWMSPSGSVEAQVDLRVGGAFLIAMKSEGTVIEHAGEYLEIDPPRRLVFSWSSAYTGPGPSLVTVELEPDGEGATLLRLVHSELPDAVADSHRGGWGKMLDRLAGQVLATGIVGAKWEL
jgi:uncharacterized protein YndB with AHSA1/START domain